MNRYLKLVFTNSFGLIKQVNIHTPDDNQIITVIYLTKININFDYEILPRYEDYKDCL